MSLFVVENTYRNNRTVQQWNVQGFVVICKYFGDKEK